MSFNDFRRGSSSEPSTPNKERSGSKVGPGENVSEKISNFKGQITKIRGLSDLLGGAKDCKEMRDKLQEEISKGTALSKQINSSLAELVRDDGGGGSDKAKSERKEMQKKLGKEFKTWLNTFERAVKEAKVKEEKAMEEARMRSASDKSVAGYSTADEEEGGSSTMHQSLLANDHLSNEITINDIIIQEREEEFKQINKSIVEVNAIFKDLAVIVNEQAEDIETIESNMNESARMAEKGLKELQTAAKSQSSSRGKMVCLLFTLLGIVGAIVLWLFVFNQPKTPPT